MKKLLPAEFKMKGWRFSYRTTFPENGSVRYAGAKLINGEWLSMGTLVVKPTCSKQSLYRLFNMTEVSDLLDGQN